MAVGLEDIARASGMSVATVSKALNGKPDVSLATRSRITQLAATMGYSPNVHARGLVGARTGTVGVITSDLEGRFALPIVRGIEDSLGADRVLVLLCDARGDGERERRHIRALIDRHVDGLVIVGSQTDSRPSLGALSVPVVYAYAVSDDAADHSVSPDNVQAGVIAVEHLVSTGRTRIAHISGVADHQATVGRADGVRRAIAAAGLEPAAPVLLGDWTEGWGRAAAARLVDEAGAANIDSIVCGSDQIARGVLDTLRDRGIEVPREIAVIGTDNWIAIAAHSRPALTTVDLDLERLGRRAARRLFDVIDGSPAQPGAEYLPCSVVIRDSTIARA